MIAIGYAMGVATLVNIMTQHVTDGWRRGERTSSGGRKHRSSYTHSAAKSVCTSLTSTTWRGYKRAARKSSTPNISTTCSFRWDKFLFL